MSPINVFVVEDKELHFSKIELLLSDLGHFLQGRARSGQELLRQLENRKPDVILMDIQICGELSGIDLADQLKGHGIAVIFTTSFKDENSIQKAVATGPVAYLTKPIKAGELNAAIALAMFNKKGEAEESEGSNLRVAESIFVKQVDKIIKISFDEVLWIGSAELEKYLKIQLDHSDVKVRSSLKKMIEKLPSYFVRINSSTVVNAKRIESVQDIDHSITVGSETFSLSRTFKKAVLEQLSLLN